MFKIICNIGTSEISQMNKTTGYMENTLTTIIYSDCRPCSLGSFSLTKSSKISNSATVSSVIELSNKNGLSPFNPSYNKPYEEILSSDNLAQYKYVAFIEENDDIFSYYSEMIEPKVSFVYENIVSTESGSVWGKRGFIRFENKPIYKAGILEKLDQQEGAGDNAYVIDSYFLSYLKHNNILECNPYKGDSSASKFISSFIDFNRKNSIRDDLLQETEHGKYKAWLKGELKQIFSTTAEKFTSCNVAGNKVALIGDESSGKKEICEALGGEYSTLEDSITAICQKQTDDFILVNGNALYNLTCSNWDF